MTNVPQIYTLYQLQPGIELEFKKKKGARLLKAKVLTFTSQTKAEELLCLILTSKCVLKSCYCSGAGLTTVSPFRQQAQWLFISCSASQFELGP